MRVLRRSMGRPFRLRHFGGNVADGLRRRVSDTVLWLARIVAVGRLHDGRYASRQFLLFWAVALAALPCSSLNAAPYPSRPVRIIVPSAPGGAGDMVARRFGDELAAALHIAVIIQNKPGASGVIGNELAAHSAADGYTLLLATSATQIISAYSIPEIPYDPLESFTPVFNIGYATSVLVVNSSLPVHSLQELIDYARARPGLLHYASSGSGSANHVDTAAFAALTGVELVHVPYRGTADGYRALLSDEVQIMFGAITSALPHVRAGRLRALAVLTDRRSPLLPDVPTIAQAGLGSIDVRKWLGFVAPAGTPPEIVRTLNNALNRILDQPRTLAWLDTHGLERGGGTASDFDALLRADYAKWGRTMRRLGLRSE